MQNSSVNLLRHKIRYEIMTTSESNNYILQYL